jgi:hypothetical protein
MAVRFNLRQRPPPMSLTLFDKSPVDWPTLMKLVRREASLTQEDARATQLGQLFGEVRRRYDQEEWTMLKKYSAEWTLFVEQIDEIAVALRKL